MRGTNGTKSSLKMAGMKGGARPGAGRKAGQKNLNQLTIKLREARNDIVDCLNNPGLLNPVKRLFELMASDDENIALNASIAASRLYIRPLLLSEERIELELPDGLDTVQAVAKALESVSAAIAAGHLPEPKPRHCCAALACALKPSTCWRSRAA